VTAPSLGATSLTPSELELGPLDWPDYPRYPQIVGVPAGLLSRYGTYSSVDMV
jgi:hypothetical protein